MVLTLPNGLSFANMNGEGNSATIEINNGEIKAKGTGVATWYVRGDNPGKYMFSAEVHGTYFPEPAEPFCQKFTTEAPIEVDDLSDALQLEVNDVPKRVHNGETIHLSLIAKNVKSFPLNFVTFSANSNGLICTFTPSTISLKGGESRSIDMAITFPSGGLSDTIEYALTKCIYVNSGINIPVKMSFLPDPPEFDKLYVDASLWEQFDDKKNEWEYKVSNLYHANGNFSWDKEYIYGNTLYRNTIFDKLYLKIELTHMGDDHNNTIINSTVRITAPDGFSFSLTEMITEHDVLVSNLRAGEVEYINIPIYPIYSKNYSDSQELKVNIQIISDAFPEITKDISLATVTVRKDEGVISFPNTSKKLDVNLSPNMFGMTSYVYSQELARLGISLSSLVYCSDEDIEKSLFNLGFSKIEKNTLTLYDAIIGAHDNAEYAIASKQMIIGGEVTTLVALSVRGTASLGEWIGNLEAWQFDGNHFSFESVKIDILSALQEYLFTNNYAGKNIKLFITGHSRGAAIANLLGATIDDGYLYDYIDNDDVFVYTFATPNTTSDENSSASKYRNIINIIDYNDLVSMVPPRWLVNYNKYGLTYSFSIENYNHTSVLANVNRLFYEYTGHLYGPLKSEDRMNLLYSIFDENPISEMADDAKEKIQIVSLSAYFRAFGVGAKYSVEIAKWMIKKIALSLTVIDTVSFVAKALDTHNYANYMAWMKSLNDLDQMEFSAINFRIAEFKCPVDIEVYDSEDNLVGRTVNGELDTNVTGISLFVEGEHKILFITSEQSYTVKMVGYDSGSMSVTVIEYSDEGKSRVVNFNDIPITLGEVYTIALEETIDSGIPKYILTDKQNNVIHPGEVLEDSALDTNTVTVEVSGSGTATESAKYSSGELVVLEAFANQSKFLGWFSGDKLISSNKEYCFVCHGSANFEARFTEKLGSLSGAITPFVMNTDTVTLELYNGEAMIETVTSTNGQYQFDLLAAGAYKLIVKKDNHAPHIYNILIRDFDLTQDVSPHQLTYHPAKNATCTEPGNIAYYSCDHCSMLFTDETAAQELTPQDTFIPAQGHIEEIIHGDKETCTETGLSDEKKCSICGTILEEQQIIPAKGHTEEILYGHKATCTEKGLTDGIKCSDCGKILEAQWDLPKTEHRFDKGVEDGNGMTIYSCTVCGYTKAVKSESPSQNNTDSVKTIIVVISVTVVIVAGSVCLLYLFRKKRKHDL